MGHRGQTVITDGESAKRCHEVFHLHELRIHHGTADDIKVRHPSEVVDIDAGISRRTDVINLDAAGRIHDLGDVAGDE